MRQIRIKNFEQENTLDRLYNEQPEKINEHKHEIHKPKEDYNDSMPTVGENTFYKS
jgi:hypothetical protein